MLLAGILTVPVGLWRILSGAMAIERRRQKIFSGLGLIALGSFLVIASIIFQPRHIQSRAQGQLTACKSNLKNIGTGLEMYATDFEGAFPAALSFLTPNYLKTIPNCPAAEADTYSATYSTVPDKGREPPFYRVACKGENHSKAGVKGTDQPRYNLTEGLEETPR
jgi:hypothetical protein